MNRISRFVDRLSGFFSHRKGLLPILGMLLIMINFLFRLVPLGWLTQTDFFLHLGLIITILGFMLAWAL